MMDMEHASRVNNDPINPSHNRRSAGEQLKSMKLNTHNIIQPCLQSHLSVLFLWVLGIQNLNLSPKLKICLNKVESVFPSKG